MKSKILISLSFLFLLSNVLAQGCSAGYCGMMQGSYGTGYMVFGWILTILIIILIVILIIWLVKSLGKK